MVPLEAVTHPELTLVLSKLGCDLALVSTENLSPGDIRLLSMRTLDSLALAAAGDRGLIAHMKGIHGVLNITKAGPGEGCRYELDTVRTRKKEFYDRADLDLLMRQGE